MYPVQNDFFHIFTSTRTINSGVVDSRNLSQTINVYAYDTQVTTMHPAILSVQIIIFSFAWHACDEMKSATTSII